ncbi:possible putitive HlyD family secretion protein [Parvularcula bermudensis HTCC2503]|uniref:Possible putitive HlyD family secretion protein n=1 Tax=Parvularcula bermudensis (strain ATCC BAA-594 / HTCC2503 / KCTC 12087) TaxID=314260 RepID=E0TBB0_PARBH|nr:efflux RND transporter periplasmic adaptor subunit [Parvularcula bermudensis]ADM08314.1 possible putitive HlyD family secretion protein [Parvularcula bermudensis HTCC2503]
MIRKITVIFGNLAAVLVVVAIFAVILGFLKAGQPKAERQAPTAFDPTVFVEEVAFGEAKLNVAAQGEVTPRQDISLVTQVSGKILSVSPDFAPGGAVTAGQELVKIEDSDYRLAVSRAQAEVAQARTELEIERAESALAQQDYQDLLGDTGSGPSDLTLRRPQLARAEANYQAALANLEEARLNIKRTTVTAPFSGRIRSIAANTGQFVNAGASLGQIFSTEIAEIRLPLSDSDLAKLGISLAFDSDDDRPKVTLSTIVGGRLHRWEGQIVRVDAAIDPTTRQVAAIAQVPDPYGRSADGGTPLAIGLFVDALIEGPRVERAVTLPRVAIQEENTVYVLDEDNVLTAQPVDIAAFTDQGAIITGGLSEGQRVVVSRAAVPAGTTVRPLMRGRDTAALGSLSGSSEGELASVPGTSGGRGAP